MNLLAHRSDGTEAIIQLENDLPYHYTFDHVDFIDTYTLITDQTATVDPATWKTDFPEGNEFDTIVEVKHYLARKAVVVIQ